MQARHRIGLIAFTLGAVAATILLHRVEACRPLAGWLYLWPVVLAAWAFGLTGALLASAVSALLTVSSLGAANWLSLAQFPGVLGVGLLASLALRRSRHVTNARDLSSGNILPLASFEHRLRDELARSYRYHHGLALIALDLDRFSDVEQAVGRADADTVLHRLDNALAGWLRRSDFAARVRPGEFLIALPELSRGAALAAAERFRAVVAQSRWLPTRELGVVLTASAGVAAFPRDAHNESDLIDGARLALAEAKRRGRDRAVALGEVRVIKAAS